MLLADVKSNRDEVYTLLNALVKRGLIKPKAYQYLKPSLLR